ncbi:MAG: hypothetical protein AAFQ20_07900 [Bacteroidota bacterium]
MLKQIGAIVFLSLLLFKVSALHVYEHHHDEEAHEHPCEHCELALDFQKADIQLTFPVLVPQMAIALPFDGDLSFLTTQTQKSSFITELFSRPPPHFLCT